MSDFVLIKNSDSNKVEYDFIRLRNATEDEIIWYNELSNKLREYEENFNRFIRVDKSYQDLVSAILNDDILSNYEEDVKYCSANFLYSFRECIDHWETYIKRKYGESSSYFKKCKMLTSNSYDKYDEYKITYWLRNYQHVYDAVHFVDSMIDCKRPYAHRDTLLKETKIPVKTKIAIENQNENIDLFPMFELAKNELETIHKKLIFYPVSVEFENEIEEALNFRYSLSDEEGVIILAELLDEYGNIIDVENDSLNNNRKLTSISIKKMPWEICHLIYKNRGTDYKNL
ncbi:MAG: hypothetical protein IJ563_11680 [Selenomonadaceae bacterium]|nr:hypothetical protein [Selenomonadaceae bacterium]